MFPKKSGFVMFQKHYKNGTLLPFDLNAFNKFLATVQWGLNQGPLDHHANALLTELSQHLVVSLNL